MLRKLRQLRRLRGGDSGGAGLGEGRLEAVLGQQERGPIDLYLKLARVGGEGASWGEVL